MYKRAEYQLITECMKEPRRFGGQTDATNISQYKVFI